MKGRFFSLAGVRLLVVAEGGAVFLVWPVWKDCNDDGALYVSWFREVIHMFENRCNYCEVSAYDFFSLINLLDKTYSNINGVQSP